MRTRSCLATLLLAAAGFVAYAPVVHAEDKDAVTETARRRFQEGVKFFDQKKYEEARAAFMQAYALKHHPAVLLNLAQSEIRSGHPLEAARHFSAYLRDSSGAGSERAEAEKGLASARTKLGRIHVTVTSGAEVIVDGESMGVAPLADSVDVLPGTHNIEGRLSGRTATTTVSVQQGKLANATLSLEPPTAAVSPFPSPPPPAPPATAAPVPPAPPTPPAEVPPATEAPKETPPPEAIQVSTEGREPFFIWLSHNGVGIAGVGATLIGIGVGTGFAIAAGKASDNSDMVASQILAETMRIGIVDTTGICLDPRTKVNSPPSTLATEPDVQKKNAEIAKFQDACSLLSSNLDKRKQDRTYATIGFALAGVGLAATIAAYFMTSSRSSSSSGTQATLVPVIAPGQTGLALIGSF